MTSAPEADCPATAASEHIAGAAGAAPAAGPSAEEPRRAERAGGIRGEAAEPARAAESPAAGPPQGGERAGRGAQDEVRKIERLAGLFRQSRQSAERGGAYRPNRGRTLVRPPGLARLDQFEEIVGEGSAEEDNVSCKLCGRRYHKDYIHNHMAIVH